MQSSNYQDVKGHLHFLQDSFKGGLAYSNPAYSSLANVSIISSVSDADGNISSVSPTSFRSYLIPHDGESASSFAARNSHASYINLVQPVVSAYVDSATSGKDKRNIGKLAQGVPDDVDNQGSSYEEFIRGCASEFAVNGWSFVLVDVQSDDPTKIRYILIDPTKVELITVDDEGNIVDFVFVNSSDYLSSTVQEVVLTRINSNGITVLKGPVNISKGIDLASLGIQSNTPLAPGLEGKLPIVVGYFVKDRSSLIPVGISLIETQASIGRKVFNLQSYSFDILRMHFPQLVYPISSQKGDMEPEARIAVGSKVVLPYNSETNSPNFISPSRDSTDALLAQVDWEINKAYEAAHLDLASSAGVNSSGWALTVKSREFESAVKRFAMQLQKFETKLLKMSATILGISEPNIIVTYPDKFTPFDTTAALQNAMKVLEISNQYPLGIEAKKAALTFIVTNALPLADEQKAKIIREIESLNKQAVAIVPIPTQPNG